VTEVALFLAFAAHAAFFARICLRRDRRPFHLLFLAGFLLLALFYGGSGWRLISGAESEATLLAPIRWAGLVLLALATPQFLIHLYQRLRALRQATRKP
jgi:hypothetical protein